MAMDYSVSSGQVSSGISLNYNDRMYVSGGGTANSTTIKPMGSMYISSGGVANSTTVNDDGRLTISGGGVANETTVSGSQHDATIAILSGGTANSTTVKSLGYMYILRGGTASSTNVNIYGRMYISGGGVANETTVSGYNASMTISSGGTANSTTVDSAGVIFISSGGTALNVTWTPCVGQINAADGAVVTYTSHYQGVYFGAANTLLSSAMTMEEKTIGINSAMYVMENGVANETIVASSGDLYVFSGGTASSTNVNKHGSMTISSGGVANETTLSGAYASMTIFSGGVANETTLSGAYASMTLFNGGVANETTVVSGARMEISGGATATKIRENGGYVEVADGANATFVANSFNGLVMSHFNATLHSGTTANETTVNAECSMFISNGGVANATTVNSYGYLIISSGGTANSTTVDSAGVIFISSGGTALNVTWTPCVGQINAADGAVVTYTSHYQGVYFGSNNILASSAMTMEGKTVEGSMYVMENGVANKTIVGEYGHLTISSGGVANETNVSGGYLHIYRGGTANSTTVSAYGDVFISSGGTANSTTVSSAGLTISNGGVANSTTVNGHGNLYISNGGVANNTTISGGYALMTISGGGVANSTTVNGDLCVSSGGVANETIVASSGDLYVFSGGTVNETIVGEWGELDIDGVANSTTVSGHRSELNIYRGGVANETVVDSGGYLHIYRGGTANSTTVSSGGYVTILSGGTVGGLLQIESGAQVQADDGAVIDFTLAGYSAVAGYLVNDLSLIVGSPDFSITVSTSLAAGTYVLAQGAAGFSKTVTLRNTEEQELGTLSVGKTVALEGHSYTLNLDLEGLTLSVVSASGPDTTPPEKPTVSADITEPTLQDVTVTAVFSDDSVIREYSLDGGKTWLAYTGGVVFSRNGTVGFRGTDAAGNRSEVASYSVTNAFKTPPDAPTVSASPSGPTNGNVVLTVDYPNDPATKQYSLDNSVWLTYTGAITVGENGTYYFRSIDLMGQLSEVTEFSVTNIDRVPPVKPTASADVTAKTFRPVTVSAVFSNDSAEKQYSLDSKTWKSYTSGVAMTANGTVYFRGIDAAGNVSDVTAYTVKNIEPPNTSCSVEGTGTGTKPVSLNLPGKYKLSGTFGDITGSVTVLNGGKTVARGTLKNGVLTNAAKLQEILIDGSLPTTLQVTVKQGADVGYSVKLAAGTVFNKGDTDSRENPGWSGTINSQSAGAVLLSDRWVGFGDERDFLRLNLTAYAKVMLDCSATGAAKFTLYSSTGKKLSSTSLKAAASRTAKSSLLAPGTYYLEVESTNAKKGGEAAYRVGVNSNTVFFDKGDNSDDVYTSAKNLGAVTSYKTGLDSGWVGFGDAVDFKAFTLETAAKVKLALHSTDAAKLTIYQASGGKLKSVAKASVSPYGTGETKAALMEAGTYYVEVKSSNAKKGGSADYSLDVSPGTLFFGKGDNSDDVYTSAKKLGTVSSATRLDTGWVGFGDAVDFKVFTLKVPVFLRFYVGTTDTTKLTFYRLFNGKLNALQSTTFATREEKEQSSEKTTYYGTTAGVFVRAGTYYLAVQSTNAKNGGNADYSISVSTSSVFYDEDYTGDGSLTTTTTTTTDTESSLDFSSCETEAALPASVMAAECASTVFAAENDSLLGFRGLLAAV